MNIKIKRVDKNNDKNKKDIKDKDRNRSIGRNVESDISIFDQKIRKVWIEEKSIWLFSIVDIVAIVVDTRRPRKYWNDFRKRKIERNGTRTGEDLPEWKIQLSEKFRTVPITSPDGKHYKTEATDAHTAMWLVRYIANASVLSGKCSAKNKKRLLPRISLCRRELRRYII